jgi:hypothetical protein
VKSDPEQPFSPPPSSVVPTVLIAVVLGALGWGAYQVLPGWFGPSTNRPPSTSPGAGADPAASRSEPVAGAAITAATVPPPAARAPLAPPQPAWTRCEEGGRVTYSDAGCDGATERTSSLTSQAALSAVPAHADSLKTTTLYRCKAYSGVVFWSGSHCHQKKALVDRMVEVPRGLSFKEKVAVAERAIPKPPRPAAAPTQSVSRPTAAAPRPTRAQRCELLKQSVEDIDARTRQPLSPSEQDFWREERKKVRDAQFRLRC